MYLDAYLVEDGHTYVICTAWFTFGYDLYVPADAEPYEWEGK